MTDWLIVHVLSSDYQKWLLQVQSRHPLMWAAVDGSLRLLTFIVTVSFLAWAYRAWSG